jgi:hypothetical protein
MLPGHRRWLQAIAAGVKERGMTINVFNMPGWSGSGGPWIDIENTQRKLVHAKVRIKGGAPVEIKLPVPEDVNLSFYKGFLYPKGEVPADYRDISIVAIKLADEYASDDPETTPYRLRLEAPAAEDLSLPGAPIAAGSTLSLTFAQPVTAASMVITPDTEGDVFPHTGKILAEDGDGHFRQVADFRCPAHARLTVSFPEVKSKRFQVLLDELSLIADADETRLVTYKGGTLAVSGRREYSVDPPPPAVECADPWKVDFTFGKPATVVFPKLISWTDHDDPEIRHYSGEAVYSNHLEIPAGSLASGTRAVLDLGEVLPMAEIIVNGESAGILWCPPFRLDLTGRLREGRNELRVAVINTWFNRLARDVDLPRDQRVLDLSHQPPPETIKAKIKDQPLMKSGLLGPVRIVFGRTVPLEP